MSKLGVGETLDTSFRIYRHHFGRLVGLSALASIPSAALSLILVNAFSPNLLNSVYYMLFPGLHHAPWAQPDYIAKAAGASFVEGLLGFLGMAAASVLTLAAVRNETPSFSQSLRRVGRAMPSLLPAGLVTVVLTLIGYALCFVPGLIVKMYIALVVPAIVIEGAGPFASFGRSLRLTKGNRWAVLGVILVTTVIVWVITAAVSGIVGLMAGVSPILPGSFDSGDIQRLSARLRMVATLKAIGSFIATILLTPVGWIPRTVMFVRLRDEKEASEFEYSVDRMLKSSPVTAPAEPIQTDVGRSHR